MIKRNLVVLLGAAAALLPASAFARDEVLEFERMVGVTGPFVGTANPVREVVGGNSPWVLDKADGELDADGELEVRVKGLIIPESEGFGFNPVPFFRAIVSCLTVEKDQVAVKNVTTENEAEVMIGDPQNGDADIEAKLRLPAPRIAPVVFVTAPGGAWFAATGIEKPEPRRHDHRPGKPGHLPPKG